MDLFAASEDSVLTNTINIYTIFGIVAVAVVVLFIVRLFSANNEFKAKLAELMETYKQMVTHERAAVSYINKSAEVLSKHLGQEIPPVNCGEHCLDDLKEYANFIWKTATDIGATDDDLNLYIADSAEQLQEMDKCLRQFNAECRSVIIDTADTLVGKIILEINKKNVFGIYNQYNKLITLKEEYYAEANKESSGSEPTRRDENTHQEPNS